MHPIVSIVGESKSGKTTLIEKLISELKSRGYRVATIKHSIHSPSFDKAGKDSWRHIQAGSIATAILSPNEVILIKTVVEEPDLDEAARLLGDDYDVILAEGFKQSRVPKVEVHRKTAGLPLSRINNLIAIATDEPLESNIRQFSLDDLKGLSDFLEDVFIKPG